MTKQTTRKARRRRDALTMEDVARHAGVSAMTVSRVINRESKVSEATRAVVTASIAALGYAPNEAARALAGARHVQVALLYHQPSAYVAEFLFGSFESLRVRGAHCLVEKCADERDAALALQGVITGGIDGVLLPPPFADSRRLLDMLEQNGTPAVVVTSSSVRDNVCAVSIDDYDAAFNTTRYLIAKGHRKIGFIVGDPDQLASERRLAGFKAAMGEAGLASPASRIAQGDFSYRSGSDAANRLLDAADPPTAVFASNDEMAIATLSVAHSRGLAIPAELSIVGFDDMPIATSVWPELTTVRQPVAAMSGAAADLLIEEVVRHRAGETRSATKLTLDYRLVKRQSVARV